MRGKFVPSGAGKVFTAPSASASIVKLTADESSNQLSVTEYTVPVDAGPPLHVHTLEDETFWVLEGTLSVYVNGEQFEAGPGSLVYGPRGVPHTFKNRSRQAVRILLMVTPPGNFETFFAKVGEPTADGREPGEQEVIARIMQHAPDHGLTILGPNPL